MVEPGNWDVCLVLWAMVKGCEIDQKHQSPRPSDVGNVSLGGAIAQVHDGGRAGSYAAWDHGFALACGVLSIWWTYLQQRQAKTVSVGGLQHHICNREYERIFYFTANPSFQILALIQWSLVVAATTHGLGQAQFPPSRNHEIQQRHLLFASELVWIPTVAFIRIGIAFTLLHFKQARPWRITLSIIIAAQVLFCIVNLVFLVVQCIPLQYIWNEAPNRDAVCTASTAVIKSQYVHAGVGAVTDLILALSPLSFVQRRMTPTREGLVLILLVLLGLFATACGVRRITLLEPYARPTNIQRDAVAIVLWSILEVQAALTAANIAAFKALPPPPLPPSQHYAAYRRRRQSGKSRRTSSNTYTDSFQLRSLQLSLSNSKKHSLGHDTNVSSAAGSSTLRKTRSEEVIWPREYHGESSDGERRDSPFSQMMAAGGILMTRELDVRSEVLSRSGSSGGERANRDYQRKEEWAMDEDEERVRGDWSAV